MYQYIHVQRGGGKKGRRKGEMEGEEGHGGRKEEKMKRGRGEEREKPSKVIKHGLSLMPELGTSVPRIMVLRIAQATEWT